MLSKDRLKQTSEEKFSLV